MRRILARGTLIVLGLTWMALPIQAAMRIRVEAGTKLPVRLDHGIGTKDFNKWHSFGPVHTVSGTLMQDIVSSNGQVALPVGTRIDVAVLEDKRAGHLVGRSKLRVGLYSVATPDGDVIPIDGYPTTLNRRKVDREGTEHGHRGLVKDGAVDVASVATGAAVGFAVAGPLGAAVGGGGGLLVAVAYTVIRRGPDIMPSPPALPRWNLFWAGRYPSSPSGEFVEQTGRLQTARWGEGAVIPPSEDLLAMADEVTNDPNGVLEQLKEIRFKERSSVDRTFGKYLEAMARYQKKATTARIHCTCDA